MILGCIGDDFTGSADLGNTLAKGGMRVVQYVGIPSLRRWLGRQVAGGVGHIPSRPCSPTLTRRENAWQRRRPPASA